MSVRRFPTRRRVSLVAALVPVLVLALASCSDDPASDDAPRQGSAKASALPAAMPDVTLEGFDGADSVNLSEIDTPTVVNLWASWCGPCREEMPVLEEFAQKYAGRVDVLGVDYQDPQYGKAKELVADTGVTYPLVRDVEGSLDRLSPFPYVAGLPFMAFVDAQGRMVGHQFVAVDDLGELEQVVSEYLPLDEAPAGAATGSGGADE